MGNLPHVRAPCDRDHALRAPTRSAHSCRNARAALRDVEPAAALQLAVPVHCWHSRLWALGRDAPCIGRRGLRCDRVAWTRDVDVGVLRGRACRLGRLVVDSREAPGAHHVAPAGPRGRGVPQQRRRDGADHSAVISKPLVPLKL
eukprot:Amastigsp_a184155_29.p2 type:complete len:145 gc:universal Amastigsp_a184155_29:574-1008(+)